jgi:hypothetical protein
MEQQSTTKLETTLEKISIIANLPIEFSINGRRSISVKLPTLKEYITELEFKKFLGVISLTPDKIKDLKLKLNFETKSVGGILKGFIYLTEYKGMLLKYLGRYVSDLQLVEGMVLVKGEEINVEELEYIAKLFLVSMYMEKLDDNLLNKKLESKAPEKELSEVDKKLAEKQKLAEEKLRKAKEKKTESSSSGLAIEEILLAISYEFSISFEELLNKNYYSIIWQFGYVGKIDSHKLYQIIFGTGNTKNKNYSYWLSKKKK